MERTRSHERVLLLNLGVNFAAERERERERESVPFRKMQGLSVIRGVRCSFLCDGRFPAAKPKERLVLLRFQQTSYSSLQCWRRAFPPTSTKSKTSLQDGAATENAVILTGEEEASKTLIQEELTSDSVILEEGPKVKVNFVLEKKCRFGQRFNVVGNDPSFGNWEVKSAIPMEWGIGDIWTVDVDVPAGKQIEFKFVLTGESGEVEWQPGSNRIFDTAEGISPLVVNEAWDLVVESAAVDMGEESFELLKDSTSETDGMLVPDDTLGETLSPANLSVAEDAAVSVEEDVATEVTKALESEADDKDVHSTASESELKVAPEVSVAELDLAETAVNSVVGFDNTA